MNNTFHPISMDKTKNRSLQMQMGSLRGCLVDTANKLPLPSRFTVDKCNDTPDMSITDTISGKVAIVPIYAYGAVRRALNDLFPNSI